jgi:hypothetical protein
MKAGTVMGLACAAYIAATLQGSRLPADAVGTSSAIARAPVAMEHRAGDGSDRDVFPFLAGNATT